MPLSVLGLFVADVFVAALSLNIDEQISDFKFLRVRTVYVCLLVCFVLLTNRSSI